MSRKNKAGTRWLALLLAISLGSTPAGTTVFAASDLSANAQEGKVTDTSQNFEVEGNDSVGDALASAISEETQESENRKQSADNITGLEFEDNTAVVEFQTQTEAELVVAVYDEEQLQMLASGKDFVSQEENTAEITISGEMPQYFVATAYLLNRESHEPLCEAYTTELYTKTVQDLKNSTVDDYDQDKVVQLDNDKETNFAVLNDETTVADEGADKNRLTDNGDGTYTITNADSNFTELSSGDTFSYNYEDGTLLLVKVADISVNGTTVIVRKDVKTDLNDYFDYVKIETDGSQGTWSVDDSNLEEGVTPADPEEDAFSAGASRIGGGNSVKPSKSYNIKEKFDDNVSVTGSFTYGSTFSVDFYITPSYRYFSVKMDYSAGISVNITGKLTIREIPLGRIEIMPLPCINVGFTPAFVVEASGKLEWSGEIKGTVGAAYDGNTGFKDLSSHPKCQSCIKLEGKIFVGLKATPYVSIISADLAKASLEFSGGAEITATRSFFDLSKDVIHDCQNCLKGEIKGKLSLEASVDIVKGEIDKKKSVESSIKIADFYYSFDWNELGWGTCPHICNPVKIRVKDTNGNSVPGVITITVTDKKSGEAVDIREKETSFKDSVELTGSEVKKVYLPDGSYVVHAVNDGDMKGEANLTVHGRGTKVVVEMKLEMVPVITPPAVPTDPDLVQFGEYPQVEVDKKSELYNKVARLKNTAENGIIIYNNTKFFMSGRDYDPNYYQFMPVLWRKISSDGTNVVLISDKVLDNHTYGTINDMCVSWNNSDLRKWCNGEFLNRAFTENEQKCINLNTWYACDWGNENSIITEDKVSLPSHEMIKNLSKTDQQGIGTEFSGSGNHNYHTSCTGSYFGLWNYPLWVTQDVEFNNNSPANYSRGVRPCISLNMSLVNKLQGQEEEVSDDLSVAGEEFDDSEIQLEESEFADDVVASETEDSGQEISIEEDEDQGKTDDAAESDNIIVEEEPEEAFGSEDEEITEVITSPVSYAQDEQAAGSSMMFSKLVPHSRYLFVMVKDENAEDLLAASNLLYIGQKTADETGTISFRYLLRENFSAPVSKIFGDILKEIRNAKVTLSETKYIYDGKAKTPSVTVQDEDYTLQNGTDYTVAYSSNINAGTATVTITGKGSYTGSISVNFKIQQPQNSKPSGNNNNKTTKKDNVIKATDIVKNVSGKGQTVNINAKVNGGAKLTYSSNNKLVKVNAKGKITIAKKFVGKAVITITAAETATYNKTSRCITVTVRPKGTKLTGLSNATKGKIKVTWKRNKSVTGYRILYSTDKKFKKAVKYVNISKNKKTTVTLSKLKKGKTYYVRIATYKKAGGKVYSSWSKSKKIKTKK